jgi:flotillin
VVVWENGNQNGTSNTATFLQNMARTMPPMMQVMKEIGGVQLPESLIRFTDAVDSKSAPTAPQRRWLPLGT